MNAHVLNSTASPSPVTGSIQRVVEAQVTRTPCFIYDEGTLRELVTRVALVGNEADISVLYTLKPFSLQDFLRFISGDVDGFAVSSLFEARLAREAIGEGGSVHFTSPGLRPNDIQEISESCDYISFNSLSQWDRHSTTASRNVSCGIRVNPQLSLVSDARYDPCRAHSKLGVPIRDLVEAIAQAPEAFSALKGIHFHTNCDSDDFGELLETAELVDSSLSHLLPNLDWINLGGGYLFEEGQSLIGLHHAAQLFQSNHNLRVFIEPGAALIREAGYIVSTVLDTFDSGGKVIAVLDTTVNHMPEVFEYVFEPDVVGHHDQAPNSYILAGSSCLAGDIFGEYAFTEPLAIGDRVIFENVGAYTLVKAHMFNGIDLPSVYALTADGQLHLRKQFQQSAFTERWKGRIHALV